MISGRKISMQELDEELTTAIIEACNRLGKRITSSEILSLDLGDLERMIGIVAKPQKIYFEWQKSDGGYASYLWCQNLKFVPIEKMNKDWNYVEAYLNKQSKKLIAETKEVEQK